MKDSENEIQELIAGAEGAGQRLDKYLADTAGILSRSQLKQRLVAVMVNGKAAKISQTVVEGDHIKIELESLPPTDLTPEEMALDIIFENADVLVVNKPAGLVVHPAAGNWSGTLVHGLLHHLQDLKDQDFEDDSRPGIVHRLDKDTSGVLIVAKHAVAHEFLAAQFQARTTHKTYLAIARGSTRFSERRIEGFIHRDPSNRQRFMHDVESGKPACTDFVMAARNGEYCLLVAHPVTGRTHQIRVHARQLGLPLLGDPVYARPDKRFPDLRLMLHARRLEICLPGEASARVFEAAIPADFVAAARSLGFGDALLTC